MPSRRSADYCRHRPARVKNRPAAVPRRSEAVTAVTLLVRHLRTAIGRDGGDPETNVAWRADASALAAELEQLECLPDQVRRIDRTLRRLPLPAIPTPDEIPEEVPEDPDAYPYP